MHKEKGHEHAHKVHHKKREHTENKVSRTSLEEQTLQSLVELQKVHINIAEKFDKLSTNIENLLALFELAARNFANQPNMQNTERDKEFLDKIDKLLDQNKLLAKGLSLMEEKMRERVYGVQPSSPLSFRGPPKMQSSNPQLEEI